MLEDEIQAFSFVANGGVISGTVQSRVVRSTLDGTLDFYWRVVSDADSGSGDAVVPRRELLRIDLRRRLAHRRPGRHGPAVGLSLL
ncbi:hypothetical protein LP420_05975 [Massilia sp. B-10]|nr:hypothetical protein LP420_05975 [Massilia sp. B-10]UUZ55264.1 hypothetical protein LP419_05625 [Massilia sp. H-1]